MNNIEVFIFFVLLVDSVSTVVLFFVGSNWYVRNFAVFSRWFPPARGWAFYYLFLVLFIGWLLYRSGNLF